MTENTPSPGQPVDPQPAYAEDEGGPDLRHYINVLTAWWREILALTVVGAVLAAGVTLGLRLLAGPSYEATATVAIARTISDINFDENFRTMLSAENVTSAQVTDALMSTRRAALVGLVANGTVAATVAALLDDSFDAEERAPAQLMESIDAEAVATAGSRTQGDLIQITASADTAEKAAALATAWAHAYVEYVNQLYGDVPEQLVASVEGELIQAQTDYEGAQRELETFVANNELERTQRLLTAKQEIIASLQLGRQTAVDAIVAEELAARRQIIAAYITAQSSNRLLAFNKEQEGKQALLAALIAAENSNRLNAVQQDQAARQQLFNQAVGAETQNLLLALTKDQEIRQKIFGAYVDNLVSSQLVAIQKDQESRARLFAQYVDTEIENRLKALAKEQEAKAAIFDAYASADTQSKLAVFNEQVNANLQSLGKYYATRLKLEALLRDATGLRAQVQQGGESGGAANALAALLLKAEVYVSAGVEQTENLQIVLNGFDGPGASQESQLADLDALVKVIDDRIAELNRLIESHSQQVFNNEGYNLLDAARPADDPLFAALQEKYLELFELDELAQQADQLDNATLAQAILKRYDDLFAPTALAQAGDSVWQESDLLAAAQAKYMELFTSGPFAGTAETASTTLDSAGATGDTVSIDAGGPITVAPMGDNDLSAAIFAHYQNLFGLGAVAQAALVISDTTPIFQAIQAQYPELFATGDLSALTDLVGENNELALLSNERARELLQLRGLEDLPVFTAEADPLNLAIDQLDREIQQLQAQREAELSRRDQLTLNRDLALKSLNTLKNKTAELQLASTAPTSEVRFASPAVPPLRSVERQSLVVATALGALVGLLSGVFVAFAGDYMGKAPPLRRVA